MSDNQKDTIKAPTYSLQEFIDSGLFIGTEKDLLPAVLQPNKAYTLAEAIKLLRKEKERKVIN